jgi:hypothetical protein
MFETWAGDMNVNNIGLDDITLTPGNCFGGKSISFEPSASK